MKSIYLIGIISFSFSLAGPVGWVKRSEAPLELRGNLGNPLSSVISNKQSLSLSAEELNFKTVGRGRYSITMPESRQLVGAGLPRLPFKVATVTVPTGYRPEVTLSNVQWEETEGSVIPVENPKEVYQWTPFAQLKFPKQTRGRFLPGNLFSTQQIGNQLHISLFPVQFDSARAKILRWNAGTLEVRYVLDNQLFSLPPLATVSSVIVTSEKMKSAAQLLRDFHSSEYGVISRIVTVESLTDYDRPVSEEDLPDGYKNSGVKDSYVEPFNPEKGTGYNYQLARKITGYLQSAIKGGSLRYVTLLGTSLAVPPSYYFSMGDELDSFTPTDRCYGALDKCKDSRAAVGRLPFTSEEDVKNYLSKVYTYLKAKPDSELSLFGGHAFPRSDVYVGELGTLITVNRTNADWRSVNKYFQTRKNYNKDSVLEFISGKLNTPLAYYLDHGNGNQWFVDTQNNIYVSSKEILDLKPSSASLPPVVASIACVNAAFDDEISRESILARQERNGSISVGAALLKSKAGSVAYVGSARVALGAPIYTIDSNGNVEVTGSSYGLQLLDTMVEKYRAARRGRLGDFYLQASQAYVSELGNDMSEAQNAWSYYLAEYLGDPLLPMPSRDSIAPAAGLGKSLAPFENDMGFGIPILKKGTSKQFLLEMDLPSEAKAVLYKVAREWGGYAGETEVKSVSLNGGKQSISINLENANVSGEYNLRIENTSGVVRERSVAFQVTE